MASNFPDKFPNELDLENFSEGSAPARSTESVNADQETTALAEEGRGFQEGEIIRVEIYEEVPTIHRETFIREKVQVRKITTQDTTES